MERTAKCTGLIFLLMAGVCVFLLLGVRNESHANAKHFEAPAIRDSYRDGMCDGVEMWFSPVRGTILVLCGIPDSKTWGGLVFRVTENNGTQWLGEDAYECSVFAAERSYWRKVIKRDKYFPMFNYPDIKRMFDGWYQ